MHPQELNAADHLHSCVVDEKWSMAGLVLPEVGNNLFGLVHFQDQAVSASAHQLLHILTVGQVIVNPDEAQHRCVIPNFTMRFVAYMGTQSCVIRVNSRGLRTQP